MCGSPSMAVADAARLHLEVGAARILVPPTIRRGDVIDVRALVEHPMATGLVRDAEGHPIPAHFINDVSVMYGDREAAHFVWASGISRDPFVEFPLRSAPTARHYWRSRGKTTKAASSLRGSRSNSSNSILSTHFVDVGHDFWLRPSCLHGQSCRPSSGSGAHPGRLCRHG